MYVLGAGTSVCAGAPTFANFKEAARAICDKSSIEWGHPVVSDLNERSFRETVRYWEQKLPSYNVEELYVLTDTLDRLRETSSLGSSQFPPNSSRVRYLISKTLDEAMGTELSDTHQSFVEATWKQADGTPSDVAVITLNWDIALDRAVEDVLGRRSLDCAYRPFKPVSDEDPPDSNQIYNLLKLHGSLNWWYCSHCKILWHDERQKSHLPFWEGPSKPKCPTPACDEQELQPGMIPPSSQKMNEGGALTPVLDPIWTQARHQLASCESLVIAGYSFPPTDVQFKMLVADALAHNSGLQSVTVVTNRKVGTDRARFEDRYSHLIDPLASGVDVTFRYAGFESWIIKGCPVAGVHTHV